MSHFINKNIVGRSGKDRAGVFGERGGGGDICFSYKIKYLVYRYLV